MKSLKLWYYRNFKVISNDLAEELELTHLFNVYGSQINQWNCRSVWVDEKNRKYRVENLVKPIPVLVEQLQPIKQPSHFNIVLGMLNSKQWFREGFFTANDIYAELYSSNIKLTKPQFHKVMWRLRSRKVLNVCAGVTKNNKWRYSSIAKIGDIVYQMNNKWKQ